MKPQHDTTTHPDCSTLRLTLDVERIPGDRLAELVDEVRRATSDAVTVTGLRVEPVALELAGPRGALEALRTEPLPEGLRRALGSWEASFQPYAPRSSARRERRVLVVDGDVDRAREVAELLARTHVEAWAVGSIRAAQVMLQRTAISFDAVVLRHVLADGEGLALLERIDVAALGCSVLVIDDRPRPEIALEYRRRGAFRYVGTPASALQLVSRVSAALLDAHAWRQPAVAGGEEPGEPPRLLVDPEHGAARLQHVCRLSPIEREVAMMVLLGRRDLEIAETLKQSERTAKRYVGKVLEKAGIQNRASLWGVLYQDAIGSLPREPDRQGGAPLQPALGRPTSPGSGLPPSRPPAPSSPTTWPAV